MTREDQIRNCHRSSCMLLTTKYLTDNLMRKLSGQIHDLTKQAETEIEHD